MRSTLSSHQLILMLFRSLLRCHPLQRGLANSAIGITLLVLSRPLPVFVLLQRTYHSRLSAMHLFAWGLLSPGLQDPRREGHGLSSSALSPVPRTAPGPEEYLSKHKSNERKPTLSLVGSQTPLLPQIPPGVPNIPVTKLFQTNSMNLLEILVCSGSCLLESSTGYG